MKNEYIIICCDQSSSSGEGYLANEIISQICKKYNCRLYDDWLTNCLSSNQYAKDRILPFYFILVAIILKFRLQNVIYLNYCPLWNPLVMGLSRVGVILGPITGNHNIIPKDCNFINIFKRKYLLPFLCMLGAIALSRDIKYWSATPSVHSYLNSQGIENFHGRPFLLRSFEKKPGCAKISNAIFIYANHHPMKNFDCVVKVIEHLSQLKVILIGEKSEQEAVIYSTHRTSRVDFLKFMSRCEYFLTLSYEDAGIASFEAVDMGLNFLAPRESAISKIFESSIDFSIEEYELLESKIKAIPNAHFLEIQKRNKQALILFQKEAKSAFDRWVEYI
jgi:hypothetical protein